jgi:hypothetical protein
MLDEIMLLSTPDNPKSQVRISRIHDKSNGEEARGGHGIIWHSKFETILPPFWDDTCPVFLDSVVLVYGKDALLINA